MKRNSCVLLYRHAITGLTATSAFVYGISQVSAEDHQQQQQQQQPNNASPDGHKGIIEVDLLDKIASKPYLTYHNVIGSDKNLFYSTLDTSRRFVWNKLSQYGNSIMKSRTISYESTDLQENEEREFKKLIESYSSSLSNKKNEYIHDRPKGIPKRLRVLAIDVPRWKEVFDGECATTSRSFLDDIAPRKRIHYKESNRTRNTDNASNSTQNQQGRGHYRWGDKSSSSSSMEVIQKSLAHSLVRCRNKQTKKIGVEIIESSLGYRFNPHNMKRTYQGGMYQYDLGKIKHENEQKDNPSEEQEQNLKQQPQQTINRKRIVTKEISSPTPLLQIDQKQQTTNSNQSSNNNTIVIVPAEQEDEIYAPWHQYAWIEEMELRIHGQVPFGAKMESSSIFHRYMFGNSYKSVVPSLRPWYNWFIPSYLYRGIYAYRGIESDGIDGEHHHHHHHGSHTMNHDIGLNRASCKPHVVIADASSLQRVPGSLRYLVKCCNEADVPLFIINDHRVWGENNQNIDLKSTALDVRSTIKARMVSRALLIKERGMFERGRIMGQLETEAKWQAKELGRRTRQAMQDAFLRFSKEREDDWSTLGTGELEKRFIDRKLITKSNKSVRDDGGGDGIIDEEYSKGFVEICRTCFEKGSCKENS